MKISIAKDPWFYLPAIQVAAVAAVRRVAEEPRGEHLARVGNRALQEEHKAVEQVLRAICPAVLPGARAVRPAPRACRVDPHQRRPIKALKR